jgi:leucyl aminopeptidase
MKDFEDVWENSTEKVRYFTISFQNGSKAHFLFVPKNIGTFELHEQIREAFMDGLKEHDNISINLLGIDDSLQRKSITALSSAIHIYQWDYPKYGKKTKKKRQSKKNFGFYSSLPQDEIITLTNYGEMIAEGTNLVRTLAAMPTNYLSSKELVEESRKIAKKLYGVKFDFLNENKLKELKAGAFLSVIRGTKGSHGGIVKLSYRTRAKNKPTIALIGKGVVFDTGGYNLKTDGGLEGMHRDMTGAAVSLATFQALVKSKVQLNLDLYLAIGENLISEMSYKPNEVVLDMNGTSIEIIDTDSEGRMMLADTINYAVKEKPTAIIDFATLTGSAVDAISSRYSCVFSNRNALLNLAVETGVESGERVWAFPTTTDFDKKLESDVADIRQSANDDDSAEHIYAACFLKFFIGDTPWVHVDLSSEICETGLGLVDTSITGFGVRWCFEFIKALEKGYING